jgi:hypothetical protein
MPSPGAYSAIQTWVQHHGTPELRTRFAEGELTEDEVYLEIRRDVFAPLDGFARFQRITWRDFGPDCGCTDEDVAVEAAHDLDDAQCAVLRAVVGAAPEGAHVHPRVHVGRCGEQVIRRWSVKVTLDWHGRSLTRVYALPDAEVRHE